MRRFMNVTKALSDENRVRALMALRKGELCVCQIIEFLSLAPSTVSKHMSILKNAELVATRKVGRWVYYRLTEDTEFFIQETLSWIIKSLDQDQCVLKSDELLQQVIENHPHDSCT